MTMELEEQLRFIRRRKHIAFCEQLLNENFHQFWERFNNLCASFPNHELSEKTLLDSFYFGLQANDAKMIEDACGGHHFMMSGVFFSKTLTKQRELIEDIVQSVQRHQEPEIEATLSWEKSIHSDTIKIGGEFHDVTDIPTVKEVEGLSSEIRDDLEPHVLDS
ncbi:hypothetical protein CCACVL1_01736 [Corchorus capsularis]|uniref:Retrotransposon gag protein n=1 Tax=Corchorus capsularis TaxID=210143 RepID=A0A1R3KG87_COCAP|nr:hypothetical protein CCACVL1_01736 [Corchorus capsularis]